MARSDETALLTGPIRAPGGSTAVWLGAMVTLTLVAIAVGSALGLHVAGTVKKSMENSAQERVSRSAPNYGGDTQLRDLPPIIANLAEPAEAWVRLQASIVFDAKALLKPEVVAGQIAEDILGFMRTLSIAQIGGASGLQHLREDLNERAAIRSEGRVRELIIQALVVQ
ncbi:flagellar basal body-associated FliL family protein [Methylocapsa aurea]|uniref:flagellar basal body-associated FliL family protein n=1 Tax=Methylocapsa aurea TaxID=663610 RepID=UPI000A00E147|nr:flagellar basal body-associated FliL family protein [Methylocapsa aurea]